ncbi:hypothetical protein NOS3756_21730 [Nostoc sp. NIES-3756]|jgi:hypothetical protein|uniref:hypothetical protein n=1 Tax=Nostoc sp. NIES-3756 TaxID=1751286 RepID=UPI000721F992|nr:hypothetical protein [Nostoc sp. NIES-3756]BAT53214.1 hypothetical protein NOS3756_21730 [Nostoc sp. NIES-3756]BAY39057.1 hypothetical protein NIES2111_34070 [Nostoc sp. NIES-2111]
MASINLTELQTTGSELFQDSESFLQELNNMDNSVYGGGDGYSSATNFVLAYGIKGFEFGAITFGIDAIGHLVKSFSSHDGY